MKPARFAYHRAETLEDALATRSATAGEGAVLAGGQSLLPILNLRLAAPAHVLDVGQLSELASIAIDGSRVRLGACVRQRVAERTAEIASACPLMTEALPWIGHPSTRSRGTIGGSLAHADPAAELPAVAVALDARLVVAGTRGERRVQATDFFRGFMSTAVDPDELLVAVELDAPAPRTGTAFVEVARRHGDFAIVAVAAVVSLDESGSIADARLSLAGVEATPVRAVAAEAALAGTTPRAAAYAEAASVATGQLEPHSDLHASAAYRRHVAGLLIAQALDRAVQRATGAA